MARVTECRSFDFEYLNKSFSSVFGQWGSVGKIVSEQIEECGKDKESLLPEDLPYFQNAHGIREIKHYLHLIRKHFHIGYKQAVPAKILDVGCGTGYFTDCFAKLGFDATGVDISTETIRLAKRFYQKCKFVHGNILKKEVFEKFDNNYDIILFREYFPFSRFNLLAAQVYLLDLFSTRLNDNGIIIIAHSRRHSPNPGDYLGDIDRRKLLRSMPSAKGPFFYIRRLSLLTWILSNPIIRNVFYGIVGKCANFRIGNCSIFKSILTLTLIKKD